MSESRNEDERLRDVSRQNAESVFLARQRAEEELIRTREVLEQQARELADYFENASIASHSVGPDGIILRANRAELNLLGYSREEYVGRHIAEFHVDRVVIEDVLRRLAAGETIRNREARMRCKDGSIKHVLLDSSVMWRDGEFVQWDPLESTCRHASLSIL